MHNILKIFSIVTILSTAQAEAGGKENPVGYLCPEWNPGDKLNNKFNDSGNRTYLECNYFKDRKLKYQVPYKNGKKDGVVLLFKSKRPHHLADKSPFVDGKRDGTQETWLVDKQSGHPWQLKKSEYSSGKKHGETITYRKDGTLKYSSMFNYGKVTTQCSYRKDGTLMECIHK